MYTEIKEKDIQILSFIDQHPCLSVKDINLFFDIKLSTLRKRINLLYEYKLISFLRVSNRRGFRYYFSTKKGNKIIGNNLKTFSYIQDIYKQFFLPHILESNIFFINLKQYALRNNYIFSDWVSDINTAKYFKYEGKAYKIIPDGFCIFNKNNIYLELDRSTETFFKILNKIDVYSNFYLSMEYKKYFDVFPKVIFIFPDIQRSEFIKNKVESYIELKKYKEELNFFNFYDKSNFYNNLDKYL